MSHFSYEWEDFFICHLTSNNDEILDAILAAGMVPTVPVCVDPENITAEDAKRITGTVGHALGLYAAVLEGLRSTGATAAEHQAAIAAALLKYH